MYKESVGNFIALGPRPLQDWTESWKNMKVLGRVVQLEKVNAVFRTDLKTEFERTKKL